MAIPPEYADLTARQILEKYGYIVESVNDSQANIFDNNGKFLGKFHVLTAMNILNDHGKIFPKN